MSGLRVCLRASATVSQIACRQPAARSACRGITNQALKKNHIPPLLVTTLLGEEMEGQKWMSPKTKQHLDTLRAEHKEAVSKIAKAELHRVLRAHGIKISPELECDLKTWKTAVRSDSPHFPTCYSYASALDLEGGEMGAQKWLSQNTKDSLSQVSAESRRLPYKPVRGAWHQDDARAVARLQDVEDGGALTQPQLNPLPYDADSRLTGHMPHSQPNGLDHLFSLASAVRESTQLDRDLALLWPTYADFSVSHTL
eukprot:g23673.t1